MEIPVNPFDTPVPGQSLTDNPKNYPWENPARFAKVEDSSLHIWKELNKKDNLKRIIILLEAGISVEAVTRTIVFSGFIEGAYTPDVGILITPIIEKMILAMGKAAKVEKIKLSRPKEKQTKKILESIFKSRDVNEDIAALKLKEKNKKEEVKNNKKGLMSKGDE